METVKTPEQQPRPGRGKLILQFLKGSKGFFIICMFCSALSGLAETVTPQIVRVTVDNIIGSTPADTLSPFIRNLLDLFGVQYDFGEIVNQLIAIVKAVFALCVAVSGIMEYVTGMVLFEFFHTRLWDYNVEKWNYGNINGYVCLRSVLFFGFSGLFLIYLVIPLYICLLQNVNWNILTVICGVLAAAFIIDCTAYQIVDKRKDTSQNSKE